MGCRISESFTGMSWGFHACRVFMELDRIVFTSISFIRLHQGSMVFVNVLGLVTPSPSKTSQYRTATKPLRNPLEQ